MRFEMYMRDGELGEIFENLFGLFNKYLVFVQCTQTHVVLSKEKTGEKKKEYLKKIAQSFVRVWDERTGQKNGRTSTDLHPVRLTPLVASSRAMPQLIAMKPGSWRDSMRYVMRRIISCVTAAGVASGFTFSSVVL
jgi:hypothetical protein